ncbi:MAG: hypothetical protein ACREAK_02595 [Nitrosarchaeum sp.]
MTKITQELVSEQILRSKYQYSKSVRNMLIRKNTVKMHVIQIITEDP